MTPQPPPEDIAAWRNRFIIMNVTRIAASLFVLLGLLVWQSDAIVEGGSIIGLPMAILGLIVSFGAPVLMSRKWRSPPER